MLDAAWRDEQVALPQLHGVIAELDLESLRGRGWPGPIEEVENQAGDGVAPGLMTLMGAPAAKALIWSKTSANCSSHSSWVT
jgi:hypothetical protein